jgi:uncharacterized protein (DUF1501 family)
MATTRRQFIKRSASAVTVSLVLPKLWLGKAQAQEVQAATRRIFVVIQLAGGNDGLNTVIPYSNSTYQAIRPTLGFHETELEDAQGQSTIIDGNLAFHPSMPEIKALYDAGKVAIVQGVGYPNPDLSHFRSKDIWYTANINGGVGNGWLGKYADQKLAGQSGFLAASIGSALPKALFADQAVIPNIKSFPNYQFLTDPRFNGDRNNQLNVFSIDNSREFEPLTFLDAIGGTAMDALTGSTQLQQAVATYSSPVTYPTGNSLASGLKMVAQIASTIPESSLFYVQLDGFDHHSGAIGDQTDATNRLVGRHADLLETLSQGVKAFYDDMVAHNLGDQLVIMEWSEFGRRPQENASIGTDHGTAAPLFVIGNAVHGGLYGEHPSLTDLDSAHNMKMNVDFRSVYATILDKWLDADSQSILGGQFEDIGFLS